MAERESIFSLAKILGVPVEAVLVCEGCGKVCGKDDGKCSVCAYCMSTVWCSKACYAANRERVHDKHACEFLRIALLEALAGLDKSEFCYEPNDTILAMVSAEEPPGKGAKRQMLDHQVDGAPADAAAAAAAAPAAAFNAKYNGAFSAMLFYLRDARNYKALATLASANVNFVRHMWNMYLDNVEKGNLMREFKNHRAKRTIHFVVGFCDYAKEDAVRDDILVWACENDFSELLALKSVRESADIPRIRATALIGACESNNAGILRALGEAPYNFDGAVARSNGNQALQRACRFGRAQIVAILGAPPYSLDGNDARTDENNALRFACSGGHADVVRLLAAPPYSLGRRDAHVSGSYCAFLGACRSGKPSAVRVALMLAAPPFSMSDDDEHKTQALREACGNGHAEVVYALGQHPFDLTGKDARSFDCESLRAACRNGRHDVVKILGRAPYSLGKEDAQKNGNEALRAACARGHVQIVHMLSDRPFSLDGKDARAWENEALRSACKFGHAEIVRMLGAPPFSLGTSDARTYSNEALREATANGCAEVVRMLGKPPYSLGREDARSVLKKALGIARMAGHVEVLRVLAGEPYYLDASVFK